MDLGRSSPMLNKKAGERRSPAFFAWRSATDSQTV